MQQAPDDILHEIFFIFSLPFDIISIYTLVCKEWYQIIKNSPFYLNAIYQIKVSKLFDYNLFTCNTRPKEIRKIDWKRAYEHLNPKQFEVHFKCLFTRKFIDW